MAMSTNNALEHYVNNVTSLSQQGNYAQLCEFISKSGDVLVKNAAHLDNVLATFDIQQHSLGVLGILYIKYNLASITDWETLYLQTREFLLTCNGEHVRYATDTYSELCHKFTQNLIDRKQAIRGISVLAKAIVKVQLLPSQLTSVHADLCQLCLLAKCLKPAIPFLLTDITEISQEGGQFDVKHFLLYYYYGAMICTALKKYQHALYLYEVAITTPSLAVSHIMLESYKKYILIVLIVQGKLVPLPKYTSHVVGKYIKPLCQAYHELASAYSTNKPAELRTVANTHTEVFTRDNNMGLVKQCIVSLYKKSIQRLTKTFMTLSLTDMANRVQLSGPNEAEAYVLHMIEDGEIFATINQKDGMVRFEDSPEKYNNVTMMSQLDIEMHKSIMLDEKLKAMDREILVNPQYVQKSCGMHEEDMPGSTWKISGGYM